MCGNLVLLLVYVMTAYVCDYVHLWLFAYVTIWLGIVIVWVPGSPRTPGCWFGSLLMGVPLDWRSMTRDTLTPIWLQIRGSLWDLLVLLLPPVVGTTEIVVRFVSAVIAPRSDCFKIPESLLADDWIQFGSIVNVLCKHFSLRMIWRWSWSLFLLYLSHWRLV